MKKTMLLVMGLLALAFGATGCGNTTNAEIADTSDSYVLERYIEEECGIDIDGIEIFYGEGLSNNGRDEHFDDDYVEYIGYNEDGEIVACGGVDISWAEQVCCK